jgi:ABC-type glycerol-3-phosphate transport system substrate-binding protein
MTQLDCFFIHGTGRDGLDGYLKDPSDMGVAQMPEGLSIVLDKNGAPVREGCKSVTTGGWWWGIPVDAPDPKASYRLARFITGTKAQINDCSRFGMIPVRKDILGDMSIIFGGGWVTDVYKTSFQQLMNNGATTLPSNPVMDKIASLYLDAWYDIVVNRNWSNDRKIPKWDYIREILENTYASQAAKLLGR